MKKLLTACIFTGLLFTLSGCGSLGSVLNRYVSNEDTSAQDTASESPRVYMDELQGRIQDFTGNELTLLSDKEEYTFDVSQATLECMNGVVSGDEVSVIYEGQLTGTDLFPDWSASCSPNWKSSFRLYILPLSTPCWRSFPVPNRLPLPI